MCGLVGMAGLLNNDDAKMMKFLLTVDAIRGHHSTGVACVYTNSNKPIVSKKVGTVENLFGGTVLNKQGKFSYNAKVVIGHNRHATCGEIDEEGAHPFTYGNVTGAHNGTLVDWRDLEEYQETQVDSQSLFKTINKKGVEETWKSFRGAAAVTYWDEKEGTINLARNRERPLHYAESEDGKTLYWASEDWMLIVGANKNGIRFKEQEYTLAGNKVKGKTVPISVNKNYSWKVYSNSISRQEDITLVEKSWPTYQNVGYNQTGYMRNYGGTTQRAITYGSDSSPINTDWATGLKKADKEYRGQNMTLISTSPVSTGYIKDMWAIFKLDDGIRVHVYPDTKEEYYEFTRRAQSQFTYTYKINARPRAKTNSIGLLDHLRVSSNYISLAYSTTNPQRAHTRGATGAQETSGRGNVQKLIKGPYGLVTEEAWALLMKGLSPSCCCSNCLENITKESAPKLSWFGSFTVFCEGCKDLDIVTKIYGKS